MSIDDEQSRPSSPAAKIHFMRFNQDCTSLTVGTSKGYKLYSLTSIDRVDPIYSWTGASENNDDSSIKDSLRESDYPTPGTATQVPPTSKAIKDTSGSVKIVERLFSSSLLALVLENAPRKLVISHFKKGSEICNYSYASSILSVKLNRARLVVCLEDSLYIHNIRDMKILHTIKQTPLNTKGICALSINVSIPNVATGVLAGSNSLNSNPTGGGLDCCYLAYPGSNVTGEVQLFDAFNLQARLMITAHETPLAAVAFSVCSSLLATASQKGTVIRVFSIEGGGVKLFEFRRGVKRCASIQCLSFSQDSHFLICSSNTETIHIFKLVENSKDSASYSHNSRGGNSKRSSSSGVERSESWMNYLSKAVTSTASYIPSQMISDSLKQTRSFATVTIPHASTSTGNLSITGSSAESVVNTVISSATASIHSAVVVASTSGGSSSSIADQSSCWWGGGNGNGVAIANLSSRQQQRQHQGFHQQSSESQSLRVLFASVQGYLYIYDLPNSSGGGECTLLKQHRITPDSLPTSSPQMMNLMTAHASGGPDVSIPPLSTETVVRQQNVFGNKDEVDCRSLTPPPSSLQHVGVDHSPGGQGSDNEDD